MSDLPKTAHYALLELTCSSLRATALSKRIDSMAFLMDLDQLQTLITQIMSMQSELSAMAARLQANRVALETAWQGGSTPVHVTAEMDRIARSLAENTDALDRLSHALQQINTAYEQVEAQVSQAFND